MLNARTREGIYAAPVKHFALENARKVLEGKNKNVQERKKVDVQETYTDEEKENKFETDESNDHKGDGHADCLFYIGYFVYHKNKYKCVQCVKFCR